MHDLLHGVWHFERGMLFTAKEALIRPGKAALDYISGKRIRYYNVFYFILLLIGLQLFVNHYYDQLFEVYYSSPIGKNDSTGQKIDLFLEKYYKIIIFSFVPFFALNGYLLFKKRKLNLSEHFILAGIVFLGIMIITILADLLNFFEFTKYFDFITDISNIARLVFILLYIIYSYYSAFNENYSKLKFSYKMFLFLTLLLLELIFMGITIFGIVTNWKFGSISYHA
ncbi:DUF3667 domain-containing protein [Flavobacterium sp. SM15]|uniref:DUF3667 domain-containing protein n=1 Tax=Flavobacterium sp. SM15 TaxID=2908005 RepID=UPI001EDC28E6|nr:DUF3667 domain-containing protein [Flavobacterium sp. SM15]MCG2612128.1 DUF3667 domain-containing protein [Flavobacterium sp. SM15]